MGHNSHNSTIDESQKNWARPVSEQEYDLKVLTFKEFKKKWGTNRKDYLLMLEELEK